MLNIVFNLECLAGPLFQRLVYLLDNDAENDEIVLSSIFSSTFKSIPIKYTIYKHKRVWLVILCHE